MSEKTASHNLLIALQVLDEEIYQRYREGMAPLLEAYGGSFRYDFRVAEVLKSEGTNPINRVFLISFPDAVTMDAFFADEAYRALRRTFFEPSAGPLAVLAEFTNPATP